jgi:hypothetical protein
MMAPVESVNVPSMSPAVTDWASAPAPRHKDNARTLSTFINPNFNIFVSIVRFQLFAKALESPGLTDLGHTTPRRSHVFKWLRNLMKQLAGQTDKVKNPNDCNVNTSTGFTNSINM